MLHFNVMFVVPARSEQAQDSNELTVQEGELTLKLLNLFLDALTKFPALEAVLVPFFHELVSRTLARLRNATAKEGYLDLLLSLFRAISVQSATAPDSENLACLISAMTTRGSVPLDGVWVSRVKYSGIQQPARTEVILTII